MKFRTIIIQRFQTPQPTNTPKFQVGTVFVYGSSEAPSDHAEDHPDNLLLAVRRRAAHHSGDGWGLDEDDYDDTDDGEPYPFDWRGYRLHPRTGPWREEDGGWWLPEKESFWEYRACPLIL